MTNGANYKRGKLHHSPWHSDIRTSNQLNTSPGRLSRPFQTKNSKQRRRGANQTTWISSKQRCPINLLSDGIPDAFSSCDTIPATISEHTEAISQAIPNSNPEAIPEAVSESNSDHSHRTTLLQEGGLRQWLCEAVGEHLRSRYVAQVDLSISGHICSKIVLGCNVCNCSSAVDSVLDTRNQWLWIGGHVRDRRDAELVQEMRDLCESHAAYSKGIVFSIGCGLGIRLLLSRSPVDRSSEGDDQSTCQFIVIRASSIVRIDITSKCAISFSSESSSECSSKTQTPVLCAVEVRKHALESYHMLIARVQIVPADNSDGICDIGPRGNHRVHETSDHRLVYCRIAGFFVGLPLVKLHCHWRGNWPGLVHSKLRQDRPNVALLIDFDRGILPIAFDVHAEIEGDTPEIMHPEPLPHLILDLPNQAHVSNDKEMIDVQNHCGDDYAVILLVMEHEQSSVDAWCHESNRDHKVIKCGLPNVRRLFQAIKRLSQAEYHLPRSLCQSWIVVSAPCLEETKISLRRVHIDLFLQVNSQESRAYVH